MLATGNTFLNLEYFLKIAFRFQKKVLKMQPSVSYANVAIFIKLFFFSNFVILMVVFPFHRYALFKKYMSTLFSFL